MLFAIRLSALSRGVSLACGEEEKEEEMASSEEKMSSRPELKGREAPRGKKYSRSPIQASRRSRKSCLKIEFVAHKVFVVVSVANMV